MPFTRLETNLRAVFLVRKSLYERPQGYAPHTG